MPISKFRCSKCAKDFAKIFFRPEDAPGRCPVCGAPDPIEVGPAFSYEGKSLDRLMSVACGTCGEEHCCGDSSSS
jgi:putative FmdB family regulatory protein